MVGLETATGPAEAGAMVGLVLAEAVVLYVGYGVVVGRVGAALAAVLRTE